MGNVAAHGTDIDLGRSQSETSRVGGLIPVYGAYTGKRAPKLANPPEIMIDKSAAVSKLSFIGHFLSVLRHRWRRGAGASVEGCVLPARSRVFWLGRFTQLAG